MKPSEAHYRLADDHNTCMSCSHRTHPPAESKLSGIRSSHCPVMERGVFGGATCDEHPEKKKATA